MAEVLILLSVVVVSLISLVGAGTLSLKRLILDKVLFILVAFAAGTLVGGALFDLIPEAIELGEGLAYQYIAAGIVVFFLIEKLITLQRHRHLLRHEGHEHAVKPYTYLNLLGEGIHNFLDGAIIAAAYLTSTELGIAATIAIIFHEIPQEIGDFGILVKGGFSVRKALGYNFLIALTAVAGALAFLAAGSLIPELVLFMLSLAGGGFLYIALGSLLPELHHETGGKKMALQVAFFILGILLLYGIGVAFPE